MLILVIQPFRLDQNTWQPRSMGVWDGLAKMGLGGGGQHFKADLKANLVASGCILNFAQNFTFALLLLRSRVLILC